MEPQTQDKPQETSTEPTLEERLRKDLASALKQLEEVRQNELVLARQKLALETLVSYLRARVPKE